MTSKIPDPEGKKSTSYTSSSKPVSKRAENISSPGPRLPRISFWSSPIKWTKAYFSNRANKRKSINDISKYISKEVLVPQKAKIGATEAQYRGVFENLLKNKLGKYQQEQLQELQDLLKDENVLNMVLSSPKPQETIILLLGNLDTARSLFQDFPMLMKESPMLSHEKLNQYILEGLEKRDPLWINKILEGETQETASASSSFFATKGVTIDNTIFEDVQKNIKNHKQFSIIETSTEVKLDKSLSAYKMTYLITSDSEGVHLQIKLHTEGKKPLFSKVVSFQYQPDESFSQLIARATSSNELIPALNMIKRDLMMEHIETTGNSK